MLFSYLVEMLDPEPHSAALNMALDEVLLRSVSQPTLRIYGWRPPAVSFGYFGRFDEAEALAAGREIVRRWTGGGIVEHGADVSYTLLVPRGHRLSECQAPESYRAIHEALAGLLRGEAESVVLATAATARISAACFANPVQYDLVADGVKLAGAAQRRTRWGLLHQGSIRCAGVSGRLADGLPGVLADAVEQVVITPASCALAHDLVRQKYGTAAWMRKF